MKPSGHDFPTERDPGDLDPTPRSARGGHEGGGRPPGRAPCLVVTSCALRTPFSCTVLLLVGKNPLYNLSKVLTTDTSPTYLYFLIVPCYYIICFRCLMGFTKHFYIIFGTNLLTQGPVQIAVFLPISVFRRKGISNGVQTE